MNLANKRFNCDVLGIRLEKMGWQRFESSLDNREDDDVTVAVCLKEIAYDLNKNFAKSCHNAFVDILYDDTLRIFQIIS